MWTSIRRSSLSKPHTQSWLDVWISTKLVSTSAYWDKAEVFGCWLGSNVIVIPVRAVVFQQPGYFCRWILGLTVWATAWQAREH